jgi:hypothetical protein
MFANWPSIISWSFTIISFIAFVYKTSNRKNKFEGLLFRRILKISNHLKVSVKERQKELEEDKSFADSLKLCKRVSDFMKVGEDRAKVLEAREKELAKEESEAEAEEIEFSTVEVKKK